MDLNEARKKGEIKVIALLYVASIGRTIENVRRSKFGEQDFLIREEAEGLKLDGDFVEDYQKKREGNAPSPSPPTKPARDCASTDTASARP